MWCLLTDDPRKDEAIVRSGLGPLIETATRLDCAAQMKMAIEYASLTVLEFEMLRALHLEREAKAERDRIRDERWAQIEQAKAKMRSQA